MINSLNNSFLISSYSPVTLPILKKKNILKQGILIQTEKIPGSFIIARIPAAPGMHPQPLLIIMSHWVLFSKAH